MLSAWSRPYAAVTSRRGRPAWGGVARAALVAACLVALPVEVRGGDTFNMNVGVAGIRLGNLVSGPVLAADSLRNRVVVLEFWGRECAPCLISMPKLEALHKEFEASGLVIIGAHAQAAEPAELKKAAADLGVSFTIVDKADIADGMDFSGIPHCTVFDHTGRCIFRGAPADAYDLIASAARSAPSAVLAGRQLEKLPAFTKMLKDEAGFAGALRKAKGLVTSPDEATADEAKFVVERLEAHGRKMLDEGVALKASDPFRAASLVQRCAAAFKGTDLGTEALNLSRTWKKDKSFQAAVAAVQQFAQLQAMRGRILKTFGAEGIATPEMVAQVPPALKMQMGEIVKSVQQHLPGSTYADQAENIALEFGLRAAVTP